MKLKHTKSIYRYTFILFALFIMIGLCLTGCRVKENEPPKEHSQEDTTAPAEGSSPSETFPPSEVSRDKDSSTTLQDLLPDLAEVHEAVWGSGIYYISMSYGEIEDYLVRLEEKGWYYAVDPELQSLSETSFSRKGPAVRELPIGVTPLTFTDGRNLLQLLITIESKSSSLNNDIMVYWSEGITASYVTERKGALTKEEALPLIQAEVDSLVQEDQLSITKERIIGLFELFIEDAYEKMEIQAFTAISETGVAGSFLLAKGKVLPVAGFLEETCVADLDGNGRYELLDLYGFGSGIYRIVLSAYEYSNPSYFSSLTEILHRTYGNTFIPKHGYGELKFLKRSDTEVGLIGVDYELGVETDYGNIVFEDNAPVPEKIEEFPYEQWRFTFGQSQLPENNQRIPKEVPEVILSIDGRGLDYLVTETKWNGKETGYDTTSLFRMLLGEGNFLPTYRIGGEAGSEQRIEINFGDSIPDSIQVKDALMEENGSIRYGSRHMVDREVEMIDDSRVQFGLVQHTAYFLSSYLGDYEKDWYRLFHVICTWGDQEAVYTFVINTGSKDRITEVEQQDFLSVEGPYSLLSSSWGIGLWVKIGTPGLPDQYFMEWQISDGEIRSFDQEVQKPLEITEKHNGYPMTSTEDPNHGAVIWTPSSYEEGDQATLRVYLYRNRENRSPIAVSEVHMIVQNHVWREQP